jgi:hypothetical protein
MVEDGRGGEMSVYTILGFLSFALAVVYAAFSPDPLEDIHAYIAACTFLLLLLLARLDDKRQQ